MRARAAEKRLRAAIFAETFPATFSAKRRPAQETGAAPESRAAKGACSGRPTANRHQATEKATWRWMGSATAGAEEVSHQRAYG